MAKEDQLLPTEEDDGRGQANSGFLSSLGRLCDAFPRRVKLAGFCFFITLNIILAGTLINIGVLDLQYSHAFGKGSGGSGSGGSGKGRLASIDDTKLHIVLPASHSDVNLCKLILGCSLLGYPNPSILSWGETFDQNLLAGGSHLAKVSGAVEYLNSLSPEQDDELVLMMDAYDIHMQLPKSVMISRYYETREASQRRLMKYAGRKAIDGEDIEQLILFGSGKRCAPNLPHTVACYAIPNSPLPEDLYGANTDTVIGRNPWSSTRQRFLNSGYVLGPAGAMRKMFTEAWRLIEEWPETDAWDDGSHFRAEAYHGSDQSVFAEMYGRQEWVREKLRLKHARSGTKPRTSEVFGTVIDNALSPSFVHEEFDPDLSEGNPYEFGIYLDDFSQFGHQTINSEWDAVWITYDNTTPVEEQIGYRTIFDCPARVPSILPEDILNSRLPTESTATSLDDPSPWLSRPLYTHLCLSQIPVFRHMNGPKEHRENDWDKIWWQPQARAMMGELTKRLEYRPVANQSWADHKADPRLRVAGGAWTDKGDLLRWEDLCPADYDVEIFRDVWFQEE